MEFKGNNDGVDEAGKGLGITFGILAAVLGCFNLAFIIPSLIYAYSGDMCVLTAADGFSINLSVWLQVDSYMRIAIISLLILVAFISCCSLNKGPTCAACVICFILIYSLFSFAWTIVGSVLFWGKLNPSGVCTGGVQSYMYAMLIISYIFTCINCLYNVKKGKQ